MLFSREKINYFLKSFMLTLATIFTNYRFKTDKPETCKLMSQLTNMQIGSWLLTTPPCNHSPWAPPAFFFYFLCWKFIFNVPILSMFWTSHSRYMKEVHLQTFNFHLPSWWATAEHRNNLRTVSAAATYPCAYSVTEQPTALFLTYPLMTIKNAIQRWR